LPTKDVVHGIQQWGCVDSMRFCGHQHCQFVILFPIPFPANGHCRVMVMLWRTNFCRSANCAGAYVNCISAALVNHWKHKLHTEHRLTLLVAVVLCSKLIQDWCGRFKPFGYYTHIFIPSWNGAPLKKKVGMEHIIFLVFRIFRLDYYMLLEIWSCLNKHTFTCDLCVCDDLFDLVCLMSALIYFKVETANATSDTLDF
jgi:hypothetical protein